MPEHVSGPMRGWSGGYNDVWRCDAPLCGALVRVTDAEDRRKAHDREFHLIRLESDGGGQMGYDLILDGKSVGHVRIKRETWNLVRYIVSETWVAWVDGKTVGGHDRLADTMQDVLRVLAERGAKAYGRGKSPRVWTYRGDH